MAALSGRFESRTREATNRPFNRDSYTSYLMGQSTAELQRLHVIDDVFGTHESAHES